MSLKEGNQTFGLAENNNHFDGKKKIFFYPFLHNLNIFGFNVIALFESLNSLSQKTQSISKSKLISEQVMFQDTFQTTKERKNVAGLELVLFESCTPTTTQPHHTNGVTRKKELFCLLNCTK